MSVLGAGNEVSADDERWLNELAWNVKRHVSHSIQHDDLMQEGRIAIWQLKEKKPESPITHLYTRARYAMLDFVRTQAWGPRYCDASLWEMQSVDGWKTLDDTPAGEQSHSDTPENLNALRQAFERAYQCMTPQVQEAFDLFIQGHEPDEIANYFDVSPSRVSQFMLAIKAALSPFLSNRLTEYATAEERKITGINDWLSQLHERAARESFAAQHLATASGK